MHRIIGVLLILTAAVIGTHAVVEPLFSSTWLWTYLDWWMAVAIVVGLVFSFLRKLEVGSDDQSVSRAYIEASTHFYGFLFIGILFFRNWFALMSEDFTGISEDVAQVIWFAVDAGVAVLCGSLGMHMWGQVNSEED